MPDENKNEAQSAPLDVSIQRVSNGFSLYIGGTAWNSRGGVGETQVAETVPALLRLVDGWAQRHDPRQGDMLDEARRPDGIVPPEVAAHLEELARQGKLVQQERTTDGCQVGLAVSAGDLITGSLTDAIMERACFPVPDREEVHRRVMALLQGLEADAAAAQKAEPAPRTLYVTIQIPEGRDVREFPAGSTPHRANGMGWLTVMDRNGQELAFFERDTWTGYHYG
jgi:hypothetical protein